MGPAFATSFSIVDRLIRAIAMQYCVVNIEIKVLLTYCYSSYFCEFGQPCAQHNRKYFLGKGAATRHPKERRMINKSKLAFIAAVALASMAAPALAQSAWTTGTASSRARAGFSTPYRSSDYAYPRSNGYGAFAMVPSRTDGSRYSPAASGGGNRGYNWALENDN